MAKNLQDAQGHAPKIGSTSALLKVSLGALGVVYGDIGTSPLYTMKECFLPAHGLEVTEQNVLGILSLVFWSLTLHVMNKYLTFVMRADNHGEGGILSLLALLRPKSGERPPRGLAVCTMLALVGAALLYGDGMITPALSVLSSIEGLEFATPALHQYILPITVVVLVGLFSAQKYGTAKVGAIFGPTMLVWFSVLAVTGLPWIVRNPSVLGALNPVHGVLFFVHHKWHGFLMLGSVVLCVTGGESLYADMGHFGRLPIRLAWYVIVYPALLINYMGQGAMLLSNPVHASNPFFHLARTGPSIRWSASRRFRPWSRRRPSFPEPTRLPSRPCSSAICRASPSSTPRATPKARSTCPRSTACSWCRAWRWCLGSSRPATWRRRTESPSRAR